MQYTKKRITVEARQLLATTNGDMQAIADWCGGKLRGAFLDIQHRFIQIDTLEGEMEAHVGDWIIKGVKGEFYPCKPDIFEMTYEPAEQAATNYSHDIVIDYINWRHERSWRRVRPIRWDFMATEHHPRPQWIMIAFDYGKNANRHFAMDSIHSWVAAEAPEPTHD